MQMWLFVELNVILIRKTFIRLQWNCWIKINTENFRIGALVSLKILQ